MKILKETAEILIVDKPSGWLTTPARLPGDPRPVLGRELQTRLGVQIFPVHRLDCEVSGLTVFAKTPAAHRQAQAWFEYAKIDKLYEAFSRPGPEEPREWAEWHSKLVRGKRRTFAAPHGQAALTRARVVGAENGFWRWELMPITGRPHQLRVEMAAHGCPIAGDTLYGGEDLGRPAWIALRAVQLSWARIPQAERLGLPETVATSALSL